jgi:hypothetical protein
MVRRGGAAALLLAAAALLLHCNGAAAALAEAASGPVVPALESCPAGFFRISAANDTARALQTGRHAFQWHMQEFCSKMPLFVTDPAAYGMSESRGSRGSHSNLLPLPEHAGRGWTTAHQ